MDGREAHRQRQAPVPGTALEARPSRRDSPSGSRLGLEVPTCKLLSPPGPAVRNPEAGPGFLPLAALWLGTWWWGWGALSRPRSPQRPAQRGAARAEAAGVRAAALLTAVTSSLVLFPEAASVSCPSGRPRAATEPSVPLGLRPHDPRGEPLAVTRRTSCTWAALRPPRAVLWGSLAPPWGGWGSSPTPTHALLILKVRMSFPRPR